LDSQNIFKKQHLSLTDAASLSACPEKTPQRQLFFLQPCIFETVFSADALLAAQQNRDLKEISLNFQPF
jgi:hypothetical protein